MWIELSVGGAVALGLFFCWMVLRPSPVIWQPINDEISQRIQATIQLAANEGDSGNRAVQ